MTNFLFPFILFIQMGDVNNAYPFSRDILSEINRTHGQWLFRGYKNILNLTDVTRGSDKRINALCGRGTGSVDSLVPFIDPCKDRLEVLGNYKVCDLKGLLKSQSGPDGCVVVSIGSRGDWRFEEAVFNRTNCEIATFDIHFFPVPHHIASRTHFHKGGIIFHDSSVPKFFFYCYEDILRISGVTDKKPLLLFKIDCEGCELHLFPKMIEENRGSRLPSQIVMEVHQKKMGAPEVLKEKYLQMYYSLLIDQQYALFYHHRGDGYGCEAGFIRQFTPGAL